MRKHALSALCALMLLAPGAARAQSSPGFVLKQVPTPTQWNGYFAGKQDLALANLVLGASAHINCNAIGDTPLAVYSPTPNWEIGLIQMVLTSGSAGSGTIGVYTGPSQSGTTLAAQTSLPSASGVNTASAVKNLTPAIGSAYYNYTQIYVNVGAAAGAPCAVSFYLATRPLP